MSHQDLFDLSGRTALVTGCKRGIGKAMALGLAEAGADLHKAASNGTTPLSAARESGYGFVGYVLTTVASSLT